MLALPKPQTPNPKPQTPNPKPQTPNPKPYFLAPFVTRQTVLDPSSLTSSDPSLPTATPTGRPQAAVVGDEAGQEVLVSTRWPCRPC